MTNKSWNRWKSPPTCCPGRRRSNSLTFSHSTSLSHLCGWKLTKTHLLLTCAFVFICLCFVTSDKFPTVSLLCSLCGRLHRQHISHLSPFLMKQLIYLFRSGTNWNVQYFLWVYPAFVLTLIRVFPKTVFMKNMSNMKFHPSSCGTQYTIQWHISIFHN